MSSNDPFKILGVTKKGATLAVLKKAYSKKLKVTRPDEDPTGFMALREAYTDAQNQIKWAEQSAENDALGETDEDAAQKPQEEIKYWYDEELDFHFNSSPFGALIEKTMRWIRQDKAHDAYEFFGELTKLKQFNDAETARSYTNFLVGRIFYDAGGDDEEDLELVEQKLTRPDWLSDDVILAINLHFSLHNIRPQYEWEALQLNCANKLFNPVLVKEGVIEKPIQSFDLIEYRAKEMEEQNKDDFGSFYDKEKRTWVDMSPVGIAMRDINILIDKPWGAGVEEWKKILSRADLEPIDQYQQLDNRLRYFIAEKTGQGKNSYPKAPNWLTEDVMLYLDNVFGWSHQNSRNMWEYDHYEWLHRIIKIVTKPVLGINNFESRFKAFVHPKSVEYLGYQLLPIPMRPYVIIGIYVTYRIIQSLIGF